MTTRTTSSTTRPELSPGRSEPPLGKTTTGTTPKTTRSTAGLPEPPHDIPPSEGGLQKLIEFLLKTRPELPKSTRVSNSFHCNPVRVGIRDPVGSEAPKAHSLQSHKARNPNISKSLEAQDHQNHPQDPPPGPPELPPGLPEPNIKSPQGELLIEVVLMVLEVNVVFQGVVLVVLGF